MLFRGTDMKHTANLFRKNFPGCFISVFSIYFLLVSLAFLTWEIKEGICLGWEQALILHLPDSSFASIETDGSGKKIRHCPYRDAKGNIDFGQLIYELGTLSENQWMHPEEKDNAAKILNRHYEQYLEEKLAEGFGKPMNINTEPLSRLVMLPGIGPVLAVKIVRFREEHGPFPRPEDIQKVAGIGKGTFQALRFYIRTE